MSSPTQQKLVDTKVAKGIADLDADLIKAVLGMSSLGLSPSSMIDYCDKVVSGDALPPVAAFVAPKPLTIQAYSFLSDKDVCVKKYGMSLADAAETLELLKVDPEAARTAVQKAVDKHMAARGSPKPVRVTLIGVPGVKGAVAASGDGGLRELTALMRSHQSVVGLYKFVAAETGGPGPDHYSVHLGGNLVAVGQSKAVAEKAARLVRVLGRRHQVLVKHVRMFLPGSRDLKPASVIPPEVYDGTLPPGAPLPVDQVPSGSTVGKASPSDKGK